MEIIIDTTGQADLATKDYLVDSDDDVDFKFANTAATEALNGFNLDSEFLENSSKKKKVRFDPTKDIDLDVFESEMGWKNTSKRQPKKAVQLQEMTKEVNPIEEILAKTVIKPGFEQLEAVPPYDENKKHLKKIRARERAKTTGEGWFNMRAPEMTPEVRHDLEVLKMRSVLDPKHFYKKNDHQNALPKHFHIGKVIDSPVDFFSDRATKKERKKTIVDELMADAEFSKFSKRKYKEIIDEKKKARYKAHRHAKKLKQKKGKKK